MKSVKFDENAWKDIHKFWSHRAAIVNPTHLGRLILDVCLAFFYSEQVWLY